MTTSANGLELIKHFDMNYRKLVLEVMPQARYMNLCGEHCIDDDYNDRYLAKGEPSRYLAWKSAYLFLRANEELKEAA